MNILHRTLCVYGTTKPNTIINVTVDGEERKQGIVKETQSEFGNLLFTFVTSKTLHGKATISLEVVTGEVVFNKVTATYPATIDGIEAFVTFIQPIANPMVMLVNNEIITVPNNHVVKEGETFTYDHLMLNGPSQLIVTTDGSLNVYPGVDIFIGDIMTRTLAKGIVAVKPEYNYQYQPNNFDEEDLSKLKCQLYKGP